MTTVTEHTDWLKKHGDNILIKHVEGAWTGMIILHDGHICEADGFLNVAECTRQLCDEVCEYLGENCKED